MLEDMRKSVFRWFAIVAGLVVVFWLLRVPDTDPERAVLRWALVGLMFVSTAVIVLWQQREVEVRGLFALIGAAVVMLLLALSVYCLLLDRRVVDTLAMRGTYSRFVFCALLLLTLCLGGLLGVVVRRGLGRRRK